MTSFSTSIHQVVTTALADLHEAQLKGKIPKNPLSETHFLAAWTTNAMKKKRFESDVLPTLKIWQRKARSLGKNAALVETFQAIKAHYEHVFDQDLKAKPVNKQQIINLCDKLTELQWMVNTDLEVGEKLNRHSAGQASMIICSQQFEQNFEDGLLVKPISLYIRGDLPEALQAAFDQSLLLYKVTDYKSKVKYHGEYIIYNNNEGEFLPELLMA
ncbi:DUF2913 family protein [Vibrio sp. 1-Bac 57]|uniref:DUF2913 family protein n=1 Tax=Psychromonas sp. SA13A TaxID=2686346 RepID=UPI001408AAC1|nr:DUF2913 family protein [Psychromonas sp. SA13A]